MRRLNYEVQTDAIWARLKSVVEPVEKVDRRIYEINDARIWLILDDLG